MQQTDGTFKFITTEVISGKQRMEMCHESKSSDICGSEMSNSGYYEEEKKEDSIETSGV